MSKKPPVPLYEDKSRPGWVTLSLRLKKGEHDFIIDNWSKLYLEAESESVDSVGRDVGRDLLYKLIEFWLSDGTTSRDVSSPLERLRRRVDDNADVILAAIDLLSQQLNNMPVVLASDAADIQPVNQSDNFEIVDDDLFADLLADFHDTSGNRDDAE